MALTFNTSPYATNLQLLLDASNPRSWSQNVVPYSTDLYSWCGAASVNTGTISRDPSVIDSPVRGVPLKLVSSGTDAYIATYSNSTWNLAPAATGQTWTISFYAKASTATTSFCYVFGANSSGTYIEAASNSNSINTVWQRFSFSYTMTNASTAYIQFRFGCNVNGVTIWFDGLQIERASSMSTFNPNRNVNGTTWNDVSGNARNFTWSSPSYVASGQKSYFSTNGVTCTGPASNSFGVNNGTGYTIITVFKTLTFNGQSFFKFAGSDANTRGIFMHPGWSNYTLYWDQGGCCNSDQRLSVTYDNTTLSNWQVWAFRSRLYDRHQIKNGVSQGNSTTYSANINLTSTAASVCNSESTVWDGQLAYFALYNTGLSDSTILSISNSLKGRFGI